MSQVGEDIQKRLEAALPEAFAAEGGFTTKWIVVAETIGPEGERGLWTRTSPDLKPWDTMGMLEFAMAIERRGKGWGRADDDQDDEGEDED